MVPFSLPSFLILPRQPCACLSLLQACLNLSLLQDNNFSLYLTVELTVSNPCSAAPLVILRRVSEWQLGQFTPLLYRHKVVGVRNSLYQTKENQEPGI